MKLRDLKIGEKFTLLKGNVVYIKKTEQGLNNDYSWAESIEQFKTRNPGRKSTRLKFLNQDTIIFPVDRTL